MVWGLPNPFSSSLRLLIHKKKQMGKPRFRFVFVIHMHMMFELHLHYANISIYIYLSIFFPQSIPSSSELLNKMVYFTWLITGILLIYPRTDILNHIFFSTEENEMIFISWHDWLFGSWSKNLWEFNLWLPPADSILSNLIKIMLDLQLQLYFWQ